MAKFQTLKGFRDFLPEKMAIRSHIINTLKGVFESYGFSELQTPTLEYAEVLTGKYGEEAEKLMYLFEDPGGRKVGLKYDLTVPLSRVMAQYPELPKPFKRYQIQPAFRAENPQKGRYREFWQCDIDTVGTSSPLSDAEILAIISASLKALKFSEFTIRLNSRQILFELTKKAAIPQNLNLSVLSSIDKLDKKPESEVQKELSQKGISGDQIKKTFKLLENAKPDENLKQIIDLAGKLGVKNIKFDPGLVRGLDYYTGAIFETVVTKPKIGSLSGGGRYDNLIKNLGGPDLPAVGTTIGLDRIADVVTEENLFLNLPKNPTQILVTIFSPQLVDQALETANSLRAANLNTEIYPEETAKLDKQLKYASNKGIPLVVILGDEEVENNKATIKDLRTGRQETVQSIELVSAVKSKL